MTPEGAAPLRTPLATALAARIASEGPLSVADYMQSCLQDPEHGYYRGQPAIGRSADFITAPEISQVFGELIGLWCAAVWQQMGGPSRLNLVELGPGRGTLMRDALRAGRIVPGFREAIALHLVETNAALAEVQRDTLGSEAYTARWHEDVSAALVKPQAIAEGATIIIANEFLDTLPVEQLTYIDGSWRARLVGLETDGGLTFVAGSAELSSPDILPAGINPKEGDVFESCGDITLLGEALLPRRAQLGPLAALFLDYGHTQTGLGDTLQAVRAHRYEHPLASPGSADLSAQVDFANFAAKMRGHGLACDGPATQAEFLGRLGIVERASQLMAANPSKAGAIETAAARLMAPTGMGTHFKAIGVRSKGVMPLPGLDTVDSDAPRS